MNKPDITTLKASIKKDPNYLENIYDSCYSFCVKALIRYHDCPKIEANDLFIDALLILREKVLSDQLEYLSNLQHYLLGICINLNKKRLSKTTNQQRKALLFEAESGWVSSHEEQIVESELKASKEATVMHSFDQLDTSCQDILTLFYIDHYSMEEIATEMSLASPNVAKVKKMRCLKKWREFYKKMNQGDGKN